MASMLRGRASRDGYALFLRNLLPAYHALERGLEGGRDDARLAPLALPALYRCAAIKRDLVTLLGAGAASPAMLSSGAAYGEQVARATGARLIAHAYVRYMGDLSGGQILSRILARTPGLEGIALAFHDYPTIADCKHYRDTYRDIIDRTALAPEEEEAVLNEACAAFEHNIRLSQQLTATLAPA
jgi:heme oxygenase